jgi:hypothetical protein
MVVVWSNIAKAEYSFAFSTHSIRYFNISNLSKALQKHKA